MKEEITFVLDIDGTLCPIKKPDQAYEDLVPNEEVLNKIREYRRAGARILLHTARNMASYNGNLGMINAVTAKTLLAWLEKWDIPFDEIHYGKPWPGPNGYYIDDRTLRPREFLEGTEQDWQKLCDRDRL